MSKSNIQWTDETWNPTTGCTRVSAGCDHCYAFQLHDQRHLSWKHGRWPSAPAQYHQPFSRVQLLPERLGDPAHWRSPRRIFVDSMSDLFHEDVPREYLHRVFDVMLGTPRHVFQVLTKRPLRMREYVSQRAYHGRWHGAPPANIWLGTSVEDQHTARTRVPLLLQTPAAGRFLSCEPLLGPVNLDAWLAFEGEYKKAEWHLAHYGHSQPLSWVIIGGESGRHARLMDLAWARNLIEQCREAGVAVFVKQLGSVWAQERAGRHPHGGDPEQWPEDLRIREWPLLASEQHEESVSC